MKIGNSMSEKKGLTVKLKQEFDTSKNLEVFMPNLNDWFRVTAREFRSFNGRRRINNEIYNGIIYYYNTNKEINPDEYDKDKVIGIKWESKRRPGENF